MLPRLAALTRAVCLATCACCLGAPAWAAAGSATLSNGLVAVSFNLGAGTYDLLDVASGQVAVRGAWAEAEGLSSREEGSVRAAAVGREAADELGDATRLTVTCARKGQPALLLEFRLYPGRPFVALRCGVRNDTASSWRLRTFRPLVGGQVFPAGGEMETLRTLNAPSGAGQTQVTAGPYCSSPNNLLVTFRQQGTRRSLVLGALRTEEFPKYAAFAPAGGALGARTRALAAALPGTTLAAYLDCGQRDASSGAGPRLSVLQGTPFTWTNDVADPLFSSVAFHEREVVLQAEGLDPARRYVLGFSWWDFDDNGRVESVKAVGGDGVARVLLQSRRLPAYAHRREMPAETALALPPEAYRDGKVRLLFTNDAPVPNAVVSEVWLWEAAGAPQIPAEWSAGRTIGQPSEKLPPAANLEAADPVGRPVAPGELYVPRDSFYVGVSTPDPFTALEQYGWELRRANHAAPNPYDFPTVCAWYAGVWNTPGAQNHPDKSKYRIATTPGLVEEMEWARKLGFLAFSRAAGRLVPDNYTLNNPQGWWDDAHWQKEGFYVAPFETSLKWGRAMRERGGLAFTYFQAPNLSRDFQLVHPEMMLGRDPSRPLDYTNPLAQAHLRRVYAAMRGGISGMMFDYCDELWSNVARQGGFADSTATATTFYRTCLRLAKEGLGPDSWIHERSIGSPPCDLALGFADSQRTSGDTDRLDPAMVSRSGLRWYKSRVVLAYDMDSKDLTHGWQVGGWSGSDTDGRRMLLTMAYVAASRLLLADSFRDLTPEALHDLARTFPYHRAPKSARPVDAFVTAGWPRVYDFEVTPGWHQVTLYNNALPGREETLRVPLSGEPAQGGLGLRPDRHYYAYDFWNDRFAGELIGERELVQRLRPGEARMLALHEVQPNPQFLATKRHLMQGYVDLLQWPRWDARRRELSGASQVVAGEPYQVVIAGNGKRAVACEASAGTAALQPAPGRRGLVTLTLNWPPGGVVRWRVRFAGARAEL